MSDSEHGLSPQATHVLDSLIRSNPRIKEVKAIHTGRVVGYLSGVLTAEDAVEVEAAFNLNSSLRAEMVGLLSALEKFQTVPIAELIDSRQSAGQSHEAVDAWIDIVNAHIETVTAHLNEPQPTSWPSLTKMVERHPAGKLAATTIRRALFARRPESAARGPLKLGFRYRLGTRGAVDNSPIVTETFGTVHPNGDLEITASLDLGPKEGTVYFAWGVGKRKLALAEANIVDGIARILVKGVAPVMRLAPGPLPADGIAVTLDGWPDECRRSTVIVESQGAPDPNLDLPTIREGKLEIRGFFEHPSQEGVWELLLASSPNTWQMLARFDIKYLIERPQTLLATMPNIAMEGPFGGALLLRRINPQAS